MGFIKLNKVIKNSAFSGQVGASVEAAVIIEQANKVLLELFGNSVGAMAKAASVKNKILNIDCLHSAMLQNIKFRRSDIIKALNQHFNSVVIKDIKLRLCAEFKREY